MLKKALIASLICLGGLFSSSAAPTLGGPTLSATGGSTNSSSGGVDTNAVIALIEQYGTGGGVVSNTVVQLTVDIWYTNGQYPLVVEAQIELPNSAALMLFSVKDTNSAVSGYLPGSAAWNEFGNASKYAFVTTTATEDNVQSLGGYVPAYAAFRYYASGTTASIYDNAPNGTRLVYFGSGTNSGSGTIPDGSITTNKIDSTFYTWVENSGGSSVSPAQVAAIMRTNDAQGLTVNGMPSFPAVGTWGNNWEIVSKVLTTNTAYDAGGLRVATCYYDKDKINLYYAGYVKPILAGGTNRGAIIGVFGQNWDSMQKHGEVLSPSASGWDSGNIGGARVYKFDDGPTNYMYYFASSNTVFETGWQGQGLATSTDGTNWTKYSGNPILNISTGSWDNFAIQGAVSVIKYNGIYYMYYGGKDSGADENIGLATATSPYGPWTKYGSAAVVTNAADILAEPNVFPLENGRGWGMLLGQGAATSTDLTNWTFHGAYTVDNPFVGTGFNFYLSPFLFSDNGMVSLFDNTFEIFIARPKQNRMTTQFIGSHIGLGSYLTNVAAETVSVYGATSTNSFHIINATVSGATGDWYWNSAKSGYTNATLAGIIFYGNTNYTTLDTPYWVWTNSSHPDPVGFADIAGFADVSNLGNRTGTEWRSSSFDPDGTWYFGPKLADGYRLANSVTNNQTLVTFSRVVSTNFTGNGASITNLQATNLVAFQASVFPTNAIPPGSATVTNIGFVPWRGKLVFVATNIAVGGWMWQTNGPSGAPVWGAFNPATQP